MTFYCILPVLWNLWTVWMHGKIPLLKIHITITSTPDIKIKMVTLYQYSLWELFTILFFILSLQSLLHVCGVNWMAYSTIGVKGHTFTTMEHVTFATCAINLLSVLFLADSMKPKWTLKLRNSISYHSYFHTTLCLCNELSFKREVRYCNLFKAAHWNQHTGLNNNNKKICLQIDLIHRKKLYCTIAGELSCLQLTWMLNTSLMPQN